MIISGKGIWNSADWIPIYGPVSGLQELTPTPNQLVYLGPQWNDLWVEWADSFCTHPERIARFTYTEPHAEPKDRLQEPLSNTQRALLLAIEDYKQYRSLVYEERIEMITALNPSRWEIAAAEGLFQAHFLIAKFYDCVITKLQDQDQYKTYTKTEIDLYKSRLVEHYQIASQLGCSMASSNSNQWTNQPSEDYYWIQVSLNSTGLHNTAVNSPK